MIFSKKVKKASHDFTESMLPANRKQAFFDGIKQRYDIMIKSGLLILLFFIPFVIASIWSDYTYAGILSTASGEEAASAIATLKLIRSLISIPCYLLIGFGCAAISRLLRQLVWGEPIFFSYHLKLGIKQNALRFVIVFALYGILNTASTYATIYLSSSFLSVLPTAVMYVLFIPCGLFILSQTVFYNVSFKKSVVNGFGFYFRSVPLTLPFLILLFIVSLADMIPQFVLKTFTLAFISIVFVPLFSFAWLQFSCSLFDRFVNPAAYPDLVGKGLYRPIEVKSQNIETDID